MVNMCYDYFDFGLNSLNYEFTDFSYIEYTCSIFLISFLVLVCFFFFLISVMFIFEINFFSIFSSNSFVSFFSHISYVLDINCEFQDLDEFIFFLFHICIFVGYFYFINFVCIFLCPDNFLLIYFYFFVGFSCFLIFSLCISYGVIFFQSIRGMGNTSFSFVEFILDILYVFIMFFRCFLQCFSYIIVMLFFIEVYLCCYDWLYLVSNNVCYNNFFVELAIFFIYYIYTVFHFFVINLSQAIIFILIYIFIFFMLYTNYNFYITERYFNFVDSYIV